MRTMVFMSGTTMLVRLATSLVLLVLTCVESPTLWADSRVAKERSPAVGAALAEAIEAYDSGDIRTALVKWRFAANAGNTDAMTALADINLRGEGISPNPTEAIRWYRRAARSGDAIAQLNLGEILADGVYVPQDRTAAYRWLLLAARAGNQWAADKAAEVASGLDAAVLHKIAAKVATWKPETP